MKKITRLLSLVLICFTIINCSSPDNVKEEEIEIIIEEEEEVDIIEYTTVNTITDFIATLRQNDINIKLAPGTYKFGPDDVTSGLIPNHEMFVFRGNDTNYDFTGVTFEFDTELLRSYGSEDIVQIRLYGNNITVKNLTMIDTGDAYPLYRATNINLDGLDNTIEGFNLTTRGSYPYGYGDIFGKGGTYVIKHFKHSSILIRGERNHLKDCTITQKSYGHGIFVQGGIDTVIEGCELYGEVRTSNDMLAEEGTGSPADNVNFMSVWGYKLTAGHMFSLQEDGIRAYNTGNHYITGESINTSGIKVIDCKVNKFRSGVTIGWADGEKLIQNCEATGTETAFWVGSSGTIRDSRGDFAYGALYGTDRDNDGDSQIELTIIDSGYEKHGSHQALYLGGKNQRITLNTTENQPQDNIDIAISGVKGGFRFLDGINYDALSVTLINNTGYNVILGEKSAGCVVQSCGTITDNGSSNSVTEIKCD
ncbi:hypothetical protein [Polaribacter sp. Hel1_85]|uniref:hypothetical protein n=1 Tax=Polaribacter sp. Hel1_85 TaxID=1250005 RepID=UPI00052C9803|nr:hypothetical protein [Polaribacter sp. Hel1_85]KGL62282.1 hypothetical protein PHEL85_2074 [Polaribacter sp. Hel1_85]